MSLLEKEIDWTKLPPPPERYDNRFNKQLPDDFDDVLNAIADCAGKEYSEILAQFSKVYASIFNSDNRPRTGKDLYHALYPKDQPIIPPKAWTIRDTIDLRTAEIFRVPFINSDNLIQIFLGYIAKVRTIGRLPSISPLTQP
jgi:hypothetical protein